MKSLDFLIVGQGIAGILVAFELTRRGKSFMVIDSGENQASMISSAVLHSFNLRKGKQNLSLNHKLSIALETYAQLEKHLNCSLIREIKLISLDQEKRLNTTSFPSSEDSFFSPFFRFKTLEKCSPFYRLNNQSLIDYWKKALIQQNQLVDEAFQFSSLEIKPDGFQYQQIHAQKLIFCEGAKGKENPFFPRLPFVKNKGNVLILSIPNLPVDFIYQFGLRLIPMGNDLFWLGSNYDWEFKNMDPDMVWRNESLKLLKTKLKAPFVLRQHLVAQRPTTAGQKVLLLQSELNKSMYLFNGLGTKGYTYGPYYTKIFMEMLLKE